jgi:hypothetical protein
VSDHLITPPPELVQQWLKKADQYVDQDNPETYFDYVATQAAQWGADQELEACVELLKAHGYKGKAIDLRNARRPKPPSLKEQALAALHAVATGANDIREQHQDLDTIRAALEALPDE